MPLPAYYSFLKPFRQVFAEARPILMYHHINRAPRRARIKGLYVSPRLFERQLNEFRDARMTTAKFGTALQPQSSAQPSVLLTFDDGFEDVFRNGLPLLQQHGACAIQFLVGSLLGKTNEWQQRQGDVSERLMDETQIREWLAAGMEIGSHTLTHPKLTQLAPAAAFEELSASRKLLEDKFGIPILHFCYPYGDCNERVADMVREAGYTSACTTVAGLNRAGTSPFLLHRFTARYPSRNLRSIWSRWFALD